MMFFLEKFYMKTGFNSQRREMLLFLNVNTPNMAPVASLAIVANQQ